MYALVNEEVVVEYPIIDLRQRFPNISFPTQIETHHLPPGLVKVEPAPMPSVGRTQYVIEGVPLKNGSVWIQVWEIHNKEASQLVSEQTVKAIAVRNERDGLLRQTDWVVTRSAETGEPIPTNYSVYRQALRDITKQAGFPWDVIWPDRP